MPPVNDDFANAAVISGPSGSTTGSNVGATWETGEPAQEAGDGTNTVWWKWTAPGSGAVTFTLDGSTFDTVLEVYTGSALGALTLVGYNDDGDTGLTSDFTFTPATGTTYRIRVHGYDDTEEGAIALAWSTAAPPPPDVTSFTPASGRVGATVTITGTGFVGIDTVSICGRSAPFVVDSSTQITATVPSGAAGVNGPVVVANSSGSDSLDGFTPLYPGPWIQPDDTDTSFNLRGSLYTLTETVGTADGAPDPTGAAVDVHNASILAVVDRVEDERSIGGTLTGWIWTQTVAMVAADLSATVSSGLGLNPVPPGTLPPDAVSYEYEHPQGSALGPLALAITTSNAGEFLDDTTKTLDPTVDVFATRMEIRRLTAGDYVAGVSGLYGEFTSDVWPALSVLTGATVLLSSPMAHDASEMEFRNDLTFTPDTYVTSEATDTATVDLTLDDLDPGYTLGIAGVLDRHTTEAQLTVPSSTVPGEHKQASATASVGLTIDYRPPRYRFLYSHPLTHPGVRQRQIPGTVRQRQHARPVRQRQMPR